VISVVRERIPGGSSVSANDSVGVDPPITEIPTLGRYLGSAFDNDRLPRELDDRGTLAIITPRRIGHGIIPTTLAVQ
jgi:hypothetical protein